MRFAYVRLLLLILEDRASFKPSEVRVTKMLEVRIWTR